MYSFDGRTPRVGAETYVSPHALVIGDVTIGDRCYVGHGVILRGDYGSIDVGEGTAVEEGVVVHAPPGKLCRIGARVTIGHGAIIHSAVIADFAVIGMGSIVSLYAEVGEGTIIAEGAVVKMHQVVPAGLVAAGNPAREVRKVEPRDREYWAMAKQLYVDLARKYLRLGMEPIEG
jgi:carbonic anhydrase/acetyltransferase-like protein (isoleucine patch superfamily)